MIDGIRNYFYERRKGLATFAGVVGSVYIAGQHGLGRLEEMRVERSESKQSKDNIKRRFQQNQENVSFTIMTLLPTLSQQIMTEMDVEALTKELQLISKSKAKGARPSLPDRRPSEMSYGGLTSSIENLRDSRTEFQDMSASMTSDMSLVSERGPSSSTTAGMQMPLAASTRSWVDDFSSEAGTSQRRMQGRVTEDLARGSRESSVASRANMSDSIVSESIATTSTSDAEHSQAASSASEPDPPISSGRSKGELWREIKIMTFTRALTIIYSTTLLSLLTNIQLNLIGRSKYVQSMIHLHHEELLRDRMQFSLSVASLFWGGVPDLNSAEEDTIDIPDIYAITEITELKFFTLSWWLLHVGWKDVRERVRRSVEEVVEDIPLKSQLDAMEIHRLICDVRRRVEHEVTYEGTERKTNFLSSLIPSTQEMLQHVLVQGGLNAAQATASDSCFTSLLEETRQIISSPHFGRILEACLDSATDHLLNGLRKTVFSPLPVAAPGSPEEQEAQTVGEVTSIRVTDREVIELRNREMKVQLARMLPGFARWCKTALDGLPNELVEDLTNLKEMSALAAVIYTSYDELL